MLQSTEKLSSKSRRRIQAALRKLHFRRGFGESASWMIAERLHAEEFWRPVWWRYPAQGCAHMEGYRRQGGRFGIRRASFRPLSATSSRVSRGLERERSGGAHAGLEGEVPVGSEVPCVRPRIYGKVLLASNRLQSPSRLPPSRFYRGSSEESLRQRLSWQTMRAISS